MPPYLTPKADQFNISDLRAAADIIEEVSDTKTYLGFCSPGTTSESDATWSILKIEHSGTVKPIITTFKWATGLCFFNLKFSERGNYEYKFKNF